jgi:hypothetical protein
MTEVLPVIQADRDAAAAYLRMIPGFPEAHAQAFEDGGYDHLADALPQHFAAHRIAGQAELRAALEPFAAFDDGRAPEHLPITSGSGMARRQLTIGDCRKAKAALSAAPFKGGIA